MVNSSLDAPQAGQTQVSGTLSHGVWGGMPLIDAPVRKAFFWPCVVGVLIAIGYGSCLRPRLPVNLHGRAAANSSGRLVVICMGGSQ